MKHILTGFTAKRGPAAYVRMFDEDGVSNHYPDAIPVEDVHSRLFNWEAVSRPAGYQNPDKSWTIDPIRQDIVRSDTGAVMGVFKQGYQPHQYGEWLVKNIETILDADLKIGSAGVLKGGALAFVQVELVETVDINGLEFRPYITGATSFDGSLSSTYATGANVITCDNMLSGALFSAATRIKIKHSVNSLGRITDVRKALDIVHTVSDDFAAQVDQLMNRAVTDKEWAAFVQAYTEPSNPDSKAGASIAERRSSELAYLWNADERVSPWAGTAFGVVQAVNTHTHHVATVRGADRLERNMERMMTGKIDALDQGTLALLDRVQGR